MRVLVFGATGMLGHTLARRFAQQFETFATVRATESDPLTATILSGATIIPGIDVRNGETVERVFRETRPDVVVNAIGIVKQDLSGTDEAECDAINARFPHRLANVAERYGTRVISVSTDCVFSGRRGGYTEGDEPDAEDVYGRSKQRGEVVSGNVLTLRTSIIGRELTGAQGLIEWFLSNRGGSVQGYTHAIFSGFPTCVLSDIICDLIVNHDSLRGLYHVSSEAISKRDLLDIVNRAFDTRIEIIPDDSLRIDRSLNSNRFREATGFVPKTWEEMVAQMHLDAVPYGEWRKG